MLDFVDFIWQVMFGLVTLVDVGDLFVTDIFYLHLQALELKKLVW